MVEEAGYVFKRFLARGGGVLQALPTWAGLIRKRESVASRMEALVPHGALRWQ